VVDVEVVAQEGGKEALFFSLCLNARNYQFREKRSLQPIETRALVNYSKFTVGLRLFHGVSSILFIYKKARLVVCQLVKSSAPIYFSSYFLLLSALINYHTLGASDEIYQCLWKL
jgi:hypothetical protein